MPQAVTASQHNLYFVYCIHLTRFNLFCQGMD